jgi:hypothetical protein
MDNPNVMVSFYMDAVEFKAESEKAGRPIFKEVPFIRKMVPGDPSNIVERVAKDWDKQQHPRAWDRFERERKSGAVEGTPLSEWPGINRAQIKEANYFEVYSLEQLAALSDGNVQKMGMGFRELREKAKAYLDASTGDSAKVSQLAADNQRAQDMIKDLQSQITALADDKPKVGRHKKEMAES